MTIPVLFLDDASRCFGEIDRARAEQAAVTLISTLRRLRKINNKFALNTEGPIAKHQIADTWSLQAVLGGNSFREEWDFIRGLSDRSPFSLGLSESMQQEIDSMEFHTRPAMIPSKALAWAALLESAIVSFEFHPDWGQAWVDTIYCEIDPDGGLTEAEGRVKNASRPAHADEHSEWLKGLGLATVPTASEVWSERAERFPGLRFLPRVEKDLFALEGSGIPFQRALASLEALSEDSSSWARDSAWPIFSRKSSPEGEQRKRLCLVYDDISGEKELFDWHARFTGSFPGRIHFRVDCSNRVIVIGYVGGKLTREITDS
jgi:hypothetical protein